MLAPNLNGRMPCDAMLCDTMLCGAMLCDAVRCCQGFVMLVLCDAFCWCCRDAVVMLSVLCDAVRAV
jgi:hypothetical protein